ncbi:MAG: HEAT repeat domain-containing protein [Myxococcales bacterium]|nr:HEAT repeat domain-containing protein [Myxococcales bacterium]
MRRKNLLARATLTIALTMTSGAFVAGCENEADPKTWVKKLSEPSRRTGAMVRLKKIFDETLAGANQDTNNPRVRAFLDSSLEAVARTFIANADDNIMRKEAIEILSLSQDPRAIDALLSALTFRAGSQDSERIALRAVQGLKSMAARIPDAQKASVIQGLVAVIDRAQGNNGNMMQIRFHSLTALGLLHATAAVDSIARVLSRRLADQEISTARAAADALGVIGDPRGVDALVYGLFLNVRAQNAFPHCQRALARIGAQHAVPKLLATLAGQNTQVNGLITEYGNIPNGPPVPEGLVKSTTADVLREFASPDAVQPLLALLNSTTESENVRAAAGEALAYTAMALPAQKPAIVQALHAAFNRDRNPSAETGWSALTFASKLSLVGDPSSIPLVTAALNNRGIQDFQYAPQRAGLLLAFASLARHNDIALFDRIEGDLRRQFQNALNEDASLARDIRPQIATLDKLRSVVEVVRTCNDGDTACYIRALDGQSTESVRKAAYMLAWTTPEAQRASAITALEAKLNHQDLLVRRSIMVAIDALTPSGSASTVTKLQELIRAEEGQESKILSHLWAELLIGRLRSRAH